MKKNSHLFSRRGITLIEALVGIAVFSLIAIGVYQSFILTAQLVQASRLEVDSAALANEQFEIAHNLPYADVGVAGDLFLPGKIHLAQTIVRDNANFLVETNIQNIDDPFDGVIGGEPNDTSPADYKRMEIKISIPDNPRFAPQSYTEFIAPKNLENSSTNGALFIRVFNASGQPVPEADVHIEYNQTEPPTVVNDSTNKYGILQLVDVPPGIDAYEITVSKAGYSEDTLSPPATVAMQQVTQTSFVIDQTSVLNVETVTETCVPVGNIAFLLTGAKQFDQSFATDGEGKKTISDLEWDTYSLALNDDTYDLAGAISPIPFSLAPGSVQNIKVAVSLKNPNAFLVSVKEGGSELPLSGVEVKLTKEELTKTLITGRGSLRQTDWSGGAGQDNFLNNTEYFDSDGNIETNDPAGELKLKTAFELYADAGILTSSTFDTGSISNYYQLEFLPHDQPPQTGADSVKLQIAANNDKETWNFTGPDGTAGTFYSAANANISSDNNGRRYLRYRLYLSTASTTYTPDVGEISFTFSSLCVPSGQVLFDGLEGATSTLAVSKSGYQPISEEVDISAPWQQREIILMPE